jgi:hypothetical protein
MMSYIWHLMKYWLFSFLFVNLIIVFEIRFGTGGKIMKCYGLSIEVILIIQLISAYLSSLRINNLFLSHFLFR